MRLQVGSVVYVTAGKEQNDFYLVTKLDKNYIWLANGKHRTLQKPKLKNPKHVQATQIIWSLDGLTDNCLRKKLHLFKEGNKFV